jgi:hypothetical protein
MFSNCICIRFSVHKLKIFKVYHFAFDSASFKVQQRKNKVNPNPWPRVLRNFHSHRIFVMKPGNITRSLLFRDVTQRRLLLRHRRFETTYPSHLQDSLGP